MANEHIAEPFRSGLAAFQRMASDLSDAAGRPQSPPRPVTRRQVRDYRLIESDVYQQLALELREAGTTIDAGQLAWVVEEALSRLAKAVGR